MVRWDLFMLFQNSPDTGPQVAHISERVTYELTDEKTDGHSFIEFVRHDQKVDRQ